MMRLFPIVLALILAGCSYRRPARAGVDLFIGPECKATVTLINCDVHRDPPACQRTNTLYPKDCARLVVEK